MSSNSISEDAANGTKIGTLSMINGDAGQSYVFSISSKNRVPFRISGNDLILVIGAPLDYEETNSTAVGIIAVDSTGKTVHKMFLIQITSKFYL